MTSNYEKNVYERFVKASENGAFTMSDELQILNFIAEKYNLQTITDYANAENISYPGALKRLINKSIMHLEIANIKLIINPKNL